MMQSWFEEAKFGIFLHWGIYSAGEWAESWPFFNNEVSYQDYMSKAAEFTAAKYDPEAWAQLFHDAGARYAVLTTKHHDGFALWDTALSSLNAKEASPAGRDLVAPYCTALRRHGLKVGLYFSHLDWSQPDYPSVLPERYRGDGTKDHFFYKACAYPQGKEDPALWEKFLEFHRGQLKELCTRYAPDILWFDGEWERDAGQWRFDQLRDQLHEWAPGVILNSRMGEHGDYNTPEQAIPIARPEGSWEFCVTLNNSWGFQKKDQDHKSVRQCLRMLSECVGMGGNLLLAIGPLADGSLQPAQEEVLRGMGRWTKKHAEAIYGTVAGLPHGHFYGPSCLKNDRTVLYLYVFDRPVDGVEVKGIRNKVLRVEVVGGGALNHKVVGGAPWVHLPGVLWIEIPERVLDPEITVVKVELEGPLDLYTGSGHAVTVN